jgi:hypothetical protein
MTATQLDPVRLAVITQQKQNFATYAHDWVPIQVALTDFLGASGVPIIAFAIYTAFAGEVYHATKHFSGGSLLTEVDTLVAKYSDDAHLGATAAANLTGIRSQVFHLDAAPITP